ncbi:hypothetical protein DPMN_023209 [Dreissena polymorpha]|uniref:Uncharacterized protein n=1 Tax=Dreissena polymorpha TaxID=45954 RepID=A0A9D4RB61_DREPO|nr:hypothetical protein DPMN_023209 [Dreissena polymorpha]
MTDRQKPRYPLFFEEWGIQNLKKAISSKKQYHHTELKRGALFHTDNDDDDDVKGAGFEPSCSNSAEEDSSTCISADKDWSDSRNEPSSIAENISSSSPGSKMSIKGQSVKDDEEEDAEESNVEHTLEYIALYYVYLCLLPESALLNNDDDDKEAGFQPTSSNSAEMDSSKGTSCFKNRQERAILRDDDGSGSRNEPSSIAENYFNLSSSGSKMSTKGQNAEVAGFADIKTFLDSIASMSLIHVCVTNTIDYGYLCLERPPVEVMDVSLCTTVSRNPSPTMSLCPSPIMSPCPSLEKRPSLRQ